MSPGKSPPENEAERLERCHELATETNRIVDAVRQELPEAPLDFDDGDTSLPAQLTRVGASSTISSTRRRVDPLPKNAGSAAIHATRNAGSLPRPTRRARGRCPAHPTRSVPSPRAGAGDRAVRPELPSLSRC